MSKERILIIGSCSSIYLKQYVHRVIDKDRFEIYLSAPSNIDIETRNFYEEIGVHLVDIYKKEGVLSKIPQISTLLSFKKNIRKLCGNEKLDYIHIHYVGNNRLMKLLGNFFQKVSKKLILTFWGSDILAINIRDAYYLTSLLDDANKVVLSTKSMVEKFREYYGNKYDEKIVSILFGNPVLEDILSNRVSDGVKFDFPQNKIKIAIGYNGATRQNHIRIIDELGKLPQNIKEKLFIVIQATYGINDESYLLSIDEKLKEAGLEGTTLREFLNGVSTKNLKENIDIFIHGQDSDALSSSVLEYIYFGAIIINPSWIDYTEWKNLGISYREYNDFSEISPMLSNIINNFQNIKNSNKEKNKKIIEDTFTWDANLSLWRGLYGEGNKSGKED